MAARYNVISQNREVQVLGPTEVIDVEKVGIMTKPTGIYVEYPLPLVLWETQTSGTATLLPSSLRFQPGASYHWKVKAQTSWNRWVSSDLVEFSIGPPRP